MALRLKSSLTTGGLANPVVATAELLGAILTGLLAVLAPIVGVALVAVGLIFTIRWTGRLQPLGRRTASGPGARGSPSNSSPASTG